MEQITTVVNELFSNSFGYLLNPNKRVFIPYLLSSLVFAFYVYQKKSNAKNFTAYIFPKKTWLSKSAQTDYKILLFNSLLKVVFLSPILLLATPIALFSHYLLVNNLGLNTLKHNEYLGVLLFTLSLTLVSDFCSYLLHFAMHKIPFLWEFHKTHHSATSLNPFTQYRLHPFELLLNNLKNLFIVSTLTGVFFYFYGFQIHKSTIIGVNIFHFLFLSFGANLRHSSVKLKYFNFLEFFLISPYQHQIHHSNKAEHFNKNMGSKLAIWDYLFGTLVRSKDVSKIQFGLGNNQKESNSFRSNIFGPFKSIFKQITN